LLLEYKADLLDREQGEEREARYEERKDSMCYTFWFRVKSGKMMCLDATEGSHISRFVNHSCKRDNLVPELHYSIDSNGQEVPQILFRTKRTIQAGEELLFDYGDRRKSVIEKNQWLKS
jgi:[histone H4]-lysine20 N-methyltransferase SETD8